MKGAGCAFFFHWAPSDRGILDNEHVEKLSAADRGAEPLILIGGFVEARQIIRVRLLPHHPHYGIARGV